MSEDPAQPEAPEANRVLAFLRRVEADSSNRDSAIAAAEKTISDLEKQLEKTNRDLEKRQAEADRYRSQYEQDLKKRGERSAEMAATVLHSKLDELLIQIKESIVAEHQERIESLKSSLVRQDADISRARQEAVEFREKWQKSQQDAEAERAGIAEQHRQELDSLRANNERSLQQISSQFDKVLEELRGALSEKETLLVKACETAENLQKEAARLREVGFQDLKDLREQKDAEVKDLVKSLEMVRTERDELYEHNQSLEEYINNDESLERLKTLEEEREELQKYANDNDKLMRLMLKSLRQIKEVCDKSPAARSILTNRGAGADLDAVFAPLDLEFELE